MCWQCNIERTCQEKRNEEEEISQHESPERDTYVEPVSPYIQQCLMSTRDPCKILKMAKNKDDIEYATAQAKLSEDEPIRVSYKHGTPLEGGKIVESEPVELFSSAQSIEKGKDQSATGGQTQMQRDIKDISGTRTDDSPR